MTTALRRQAPWGTVLPSSAITRRRIWRVFSTPAANASWFTSLSMLAKPVAAPLKQRVQMQPQPQPHPQLQHPHPMPCPHLLPLQGPVAGRRERRSVSMPQLRRRLLLPLLTVALRRHRKPRLQRQRRRHARALARLLSRSQRQNPPRNPNPQPRLQGLLQRQPQGLPLNPSRRRQPPGRYRRRRPSLYRELQSPPLPVPALPHQLLHLGPRSISTQ